MGWALVSFRKGIRPVSPAIRILIGLGIGLATGVTMASYGVPRESAVVVTAEVAGGLWLDALRMTILPLVFSLVITGVASTAGKASAGGVTKLSLSLFLLLLMGAAAMAATIVPLLLAIWPIPPDAAVALRHALGATQQIQAQQGVVAMLRGIIPTNVVSAAASGAMLPLIVFALVFGFALTKADGECGQGLTRFFSWIKDTMLVIVGWVLELAPLGVFALALVLGVTTGFTALGAFAHYIAFVVTMCLLATVAAYTLAVLIGRVPLSRFARAAAPAQAIAVSTQSSLASLPAMIKGSEVQLGISPRVTGVTLPLAVSLFRIAGATAPVTIAIYAASVLNIPLSPGQLAAGAVVAVIMVIASGVGVPSQVSFFATMTPIFTSMGVPIEILALLIAVEAIPDIFRTTANVSMDMAVTTVVARFSKTGSGGVAAPEEATE